jgi:hypothetical protein
MQTSYSVLPAIGVRGQIADLNAARVESQRANGVVRPGCYVVRQSNRDAAHPTAVPAPGARGGFAVLDEYRVKGLDEAADYADNELFGMMTSGRMFVECETGSPGVDGQPVFVRYVATGEEKLGAIRADADGETNAVLGLTETDANVEDGTFTVILEDSDGITYQATFTSSTSSHAAAATGIAAAIAARGPFTATPGSEVADKIQIAISHATANKWVLIKHIESVGASALSIDTQGGSDAFPLPGAFFRSSGAICEVEVNPVG